MADTKISALPAASALTGTEEFAVNQGGVSKKATAAQVAAHGPAWTAYTPTFTAGTTNPTLANFTRTGRYIQIGKTVHFFIEITCNAASGFGVGNYTFGLPVAARNEPVVFARQSAPTHLYIGVGNVGLTDFVLTLTISETNMNSTTSGMANGTILRAVGTYEAA